MMSRNQTIPWAGMAFATATAIGMAIEDVSLWLSLGVWIVWAGSLWLSRPEPIQSEQRPDYASVSRDVMRELIEPLGLALVVFEGSRVFAANAAARLALGAHIVGQDGRIALRHPEAVRLLDMPDGTSVSVPGLTGGRSLWQLTRQQIDERYWIVALADRTVEADLSRAHTDFVANASHELRTPLASVIGYVETLLEEPKTVKPETNERFLNTILREAQRMQRLVDDLMSLSHLEAEKHDLPDEKIDLCAIAARVTSEFTSGNTKGHITLSKPEQKLPISGDTSQLEQFLRNLIDNALKYGESGSPVLVSITALENHTAQVSVTDQGSGIAPEHIPLLTRRFYRTDPGRSRAVGGTGLGLAIVKHIVERHRGKLEITSELGVGTTITAQFPLVKTPAS